MLTANVLPCSLCGATMVGRGGVYKCLVCDVKARAEALEGPAYLEPRRLAFQILGEPIPKGRPRAFMQGKRLIVTTPPRTREFEHEVAGHAAVHAVGQRWPRAFEGLCEVRLTFVCQRPQARARAKDPDGRMWRETGRGDCDNYAKAVIDGMQAAGVFKDDRQVVRLVVELWWSAKGEDPCVEIEVSTIGRGAAPLGEEARPVVVSSRVRQGGAFR